jgi:membrane protein YqaA with SNARE-associated domain
MPAMKDAKELFTRPESRIQWIRLVIALAGLLALSFGFAALMQFLKNRLDIPLYDFALLAYASVFLSALVANMTIIAPVPFAVAIMVGAARELNPVLVALVGATGGTLGELSGYYAGRVGKRIAIPDTFVGYKRIEVWIKKYGVWAIFVLAFQPIIPFDVGGLIAGAAKMPLVKFLPALWLGKFPKYVLLIYAGLGLIGFLPSWIVG